MNKMTCEKSIKDCRREIFCRRTGKMKRAYRKAERRLNAYLLNVEREDYEFQPKRLTSWDIS